METGKTSKYLKYAIGEIILVVIGILIALQINNANENIKRENLRQELLLELKYSIMSDTVRLNFERRNLISAYINTKHLKKAISKDIPYTKSLDSSFAKISMINVFEADYKILDRLLNIGIEIIGDKALKDEIIHYYEDSKNGAKRPQKTKELLIDNIYPNYFVSWNPQVSAEPEDFEVLKKLNAFKIVLDYAENDTDFLIRRSIHRKNLGTEILKMLDENITINNSKQNSSPYIRNIARKDSIEIKLQLDKLNNLGSD